MKRDGRTPGFFHSARDTVEADRRTKRKNKRAGIVVPGFFVPSFGVRRPVIVTEELKAFTEELKGALPRNYQVRQAGRLAMTLSGQRTIIDQFHAIDIQPPAEEIKAVAKSMQSDLKQSLQSVPRRLELPVGRSDAFGKKGAPTRIGIIPEGWKGFSAHYAERDANKNILPLPILVREANIIAGAIANGFGHYPGMFEKPSHTNIMNKTPHVTIAEKQRGGPISQSEMAGLAGVINEVMNKVAPDGMNITLFDPITYVQLDRRNHDPDTGERLRYEEYARAPRILRNSDIRPLTRWAYLAYNEKSCRSL